MASGEWVSGFLHLPPSAPPSIDSEGWDTASGSHYYVIWKIPGRSHLVGVHSGGLRAWRALETELGRYSYAQGHRLRKAQSLFDALALFESEAAKHGIADQPPVFDH